MSTHLGAAPGDIAPVVLLPGDPLRARWIAETFLDDARCYTEVRGMLGCGCSVRLLLSRLLVLAARHQGQ